MSVHCSHQFLGRLSNAKEAAIDAVLDPFGAQVQCIRDAGNRRWRGWISSPNRGAPHDGTREMAMTAALDAAGLLPLPDLMQNGRRVYEDMSE